MAESYQKIAGEPKLAGFYLGWIGQRIAACVHAAVLRQDRLAWREGCREFQRLFMLLSASQANGADIWPRTDQDLSELLNLLVENGGWWTSPAGFEERQPDQRGQEARDRAIHDAEQKQPFVPLLTPEGTGGIAADQIMAALGRILFTAGEAIGCVDACRLGVWLAGLCYRVTESIPVRTVSGGLDDLAAIGMVSLEAENELRRQLGLIELAPGRIPRSMTDQALPAAVPSASVHGSRRSPFSPDIMDFPQERSVLAVVFSRFGVDVPPSVSDAELHDIDSICSSVRERAAKQAFEQLGKSDPLSPPAPEELPATMHTVEAIEYLGLNRRGLARPEMALQRMVKNGALHPVKVGGRNVYKRKELDRVLREGEPPKRRRRGRPSM